MTYDELRIWIGNLTQDELMQDVTYYDAATDVYGKIEQVAIADDDVVQNQPVLVVNDKPIDLFSNEYPNQKRSF